MKKYLYKIIILSGIILASTATLHAQNYLNNRVAIDGFYKRNLGNFSEVWSNAVGGYISYGIAFPDHNLLIFRSGLISHQLKDDVNYDDASSIILPLHIGGRYYFTNQMFMPFVTFMNGLNLVFENTNLEGGKEDKTLVKYAWQVGFGFTINLTGNIGVDASVNYNSHFYTKEAMMTGFEYIFGIAWTFVE
ncbi:MAG: hypothetical protein R3321_12790 [Nitrososphaeraceae archaeon]|nr:hypothetical protein [Nitrososphaeraceae archaeon]